MQPHLTLVQQTLIAAICWLGITLPAHAIWFEASGQAVMEGGDKAHARQKATSLITT